VHDGTTRWAWTREVLRELNQGPTTLVDLPSDAIRRLVDEVFYPYEFAQRNLDIEAALGDLNNLLVREGLQAYFDATKHCRIRTISSGKEHGELTAHSMPLSREEQDQRERVAGFLDSASEDELIEKLLMPLFQRLGFRRVQFSGHSEKLLEYGKDLWMKYQLPTGRWLYFCAQIKRGKIDAGGASGDKNIATVLNQVNMALTSPIFDPDINRTVLLDHMFIISGGRITKSARDWIGKNLDTQQRRHIIFMDRDEFLNHSARILLDVALDENKDLPEWLR
jgi:hypothetical protein